MVTLTEPVATGDAIDLLYACHERIRRFSAMAQRLATAVDASPAEIADAATRVHRYFGTALPLHAEDEDASLRPRVQHVSDRRLRDAVEEMFTEHVSIHGVLADLVPRWAELMQHPERLAFTSSVLAERTNTFDAGMRAHLELEESEIFPELRKVLSPEALTEIAREMRQRRNVGSTPGLPPLA